MVGDATTGGSIDECIPHFSGAYKADRQPKNHHLSEPSGMGGDARVSSSSSRGITPPSLRPCRDGMNSGSGRRKDGTHGSPSCAHPVPGRVWGAGDKIRGLATCHPSLRMDRMPFLLGGPYGHSGVGVDPRRMVAGTHRGFGSIVCALVDLRPTDGTGHHSPSVLPPRPQATESPGAFRSNHNANAPLSPSRLPGGRWSCASPSTVCADPQATHRLPVRCATRRRKFGTTVTVDNAPAKVPNRACPRRAIGHSWSQTATVRA
ncbi:hypothetical protein C8Q70DRAFT_77253 [Cubamyces menziesii]|nr:hypothetical protein C8Q70DRAFT_77253 [Cubamyces menziesii]